MAKKKEEILDTGVDPKSKKKKSFPVKKMLIFLLILLLLAGGAGAAYFYFFTDKPGKVEKSELSEAILIFTFEKMPLVHAGIKSINEEIIITEKEIERIKEIQKAFPNREKITGSEKKIWDKNLSNLTSFLQKQEKEIKDIFVSFQVNSETGQKLIEEKKESLAKAFDEIITPSKTLTDKIRTIEEAKGFVDKLKDFIK